MYLFHGVNMFTLVAYSSITPVCLLYDEGGDEDDDADYVLSQSSVD